MPAARKTAKTTDGARVKKVYDDGMDEVQQVLFSLDATAAQRKTAKGALRDLTTMLLAHTVKSIEERTALLSGLIVELQRVVATIDVNSKLAKTAGEITKVVGAADKLLETHKGSLLDEVT